VGGANIGIAFDNFMDAQGDLKRDITGTSAVTLIGGANKKLIFSLLKDIEGDFT